MAYFHLTPICQNRYECTLIVTIKLQERQRLLMSYEEFGVKLEDRLYFRSACELSFADGYRMHFVFRD